MSDLFVGAFLGVLGMCAIALAASKLGLIFIGIGRKEGQARPPVSHSYPRLGCRIAVEAKDEFTSGLKPQLRLFATVENEGETAVRSLKGYWKVSTADKHKHAQIRIQRDGLAPQEKYLDSCLLEEGIYTPAEGIRFDVEVEFDYTPQAELENRHYSAKFRYDRKNHRMIRL